MYYLIIKTHKITGLKYLCKTTREDPYAYLGSGKYWKRHLKQHGRDIETTVLFSGNDLEEFKRQCADYSKKFDVANSEEWANLIEETGTDGGKTFDNPTWLKGYRHTEESKKIISECSKATFIRRKTNGTLTFPFANKKHSQESRQKISQSSKGKPKSEEHRKAMSLARKGKPSNMSIETRQQAADYLRSLSLKMYKCSICDKIGNAGQIGRYHKQCMKDPLWQKILI